MAPSSPAGTLAIGAGWLADDVRDEFLGLGLRYTIVAARARRTPKVVIRQLEEFSDQIDAPRAVALRARHVATTYRVFQRQIGLDPDVDRTPFEVALIDRMLQGRFVPRGLPADACTIAALETGVPVWAIDAGALDGPLGIVAAGAGARFLGGTDPRPCDEGTLAIADATGPIVPLLGDPCAALVPGQATRSIVLFALSVPGAPEPVADEALWLASAIASEPA